jgi:hypothetical protein
MCRPARRPIGDLDRIAAERRPAQFEVPSERGYAGNSCSITARPASGALLILHQRELLAFLIAQ